MAAGSTYKVVELVGSSSESIQQAIDAAIARASQTIRNLDWFEVREIRGTIEGGQRQLVPGQDGHRVPGGLRR